MNVFMRWHYRRQKDWQTKIEQYLYVLGNPLPKFPGKVGVHIERIYGHRKRDFDYDNLYAGAKTILDALKTPRGRTRRGLSVIEEDNPRMCDLLVTQSRSQDKSTKVRITILDLSSPDARVMSDWVGLIRASESAAPGRLGI